jgi:hypothetical protein
MLPGSGVVVLEPVGEVVGLFEDLFDASGHSGHLRYLGRAGMTWTITGPVVEATTPIPQRFPAWSGPTSIVSSPSSASTRIGLSLPRVAGRCVR